MNGVILLDHLKLTKVLLKYGANTEIVNNEGKTPLHLAVCSGNL